jgi:hypothetical protein
MATAREMIVVWLVVFNKEPYKLYDHSIAFFDSNSHISQRYKQVVKLFEMIVVWLVVNDAKKLHHLFIALGNMAVAVKKSDF